MPCSPKESSIPTVSKCTSGARPAFVRCLSTARPSLRARFGALACPLGSRRAHFGVFPCPRRCSSVLWARFDASACPLWRRRAHFGVFPCPRRCSSALRARFGALACPLWRRRSHLNQAVRRNLERFPEDFMFMLTQTECKSLEISVRSQFVTSKSGGNRYGSLAFTEQGVAMLSSVLRSKTAIEINISIMRAFPIGCKAKRE